MPKLIIDNREITVPEGTKVIEAAERLGIMIPRFCYHPALGSVGACRVCAVKCLEGPRKGIQMSCMIDAQDGMKVSTTDAEAVDFRKHVIEWLMLHHPHDCPVCDEGGHCLLQDLTVSGGQGVRRYQGPKRTHTDQHLGPLVAHEMNRCIQCYRCVRYYQEFTGYEDLGVMQIGSRVYYGRFRPGTLESPFSGNLIDICPTGVYTDKPSRYRGRRWDFERRPAVCLHCSLGCHVTVSARYREVVRQEARFSESVNGHFICDRGRYGFPYVNLPERPRSARVDGTETGWEAALKIAGERLESAAWKTGPQGIAVVGSARCGLETQGMLKRLADAKGWRGPVFDIDPAAANVRTAVSRLDSDLRVSLREIETADCIVVVSADPLNESPMLAPALRQARRNGARVAVIDPRPASLPFQFDHFPVAPDDLAAAMAILIRKCADKEPLSELGKTAVRSLRGVSDGADIPDADGLAALYDDLHDSRRPVIVCGTHTAPPEIPGMAADLALLLRIAGPRAGLFYVMPGPNSFGAALLSDPALSFGDLVSSIEEGETKALVVAESDLFGSGIDWDRLQNALNKLELLVTLDYIDSQTTRAARILIPTLTAYETPSLSINNEGRVQQSPAAFRGGDPIARTGGGEHPPRAFRRDIPGREMGAAWTALPTLGGRNPGSAPVNLTAWLGDAHPALTSLPESSDFPPDGVRLPLAENAGERFQTDRFSHGEKEEDALTLLVADSTFGTEELSSLSPILKELTPSPCIQIHPEDAAEFDLSTGDAVRIDTGAGTAVLPVQTTDRIARRVLVIPRHRDLDDRLPRERRTVLSKTAIRKATEDA